MKHGFLISAIFWIIVSGIIGCKSYKEKTVSIPDNQLEISNKKEENNPVIRHIRTADPSAHVWKDGKIWMYTSHDMEDAVNYNTMDGYRAFSSIDMVNWTDHGEILHSKDISWGVPEWIWAGYSPFSITSDAMQYLSNDANNKQPFLAFISLATPHFPHQSAPKKYKDIYPQETLKINPNVPKQLEARTPEELKGYYGHCTATDEAIGKVLDKINELGKWDNTIIVFLADHGAMMGAHRVKPRPIQ